MRIQMLDVIITQNFGILSGHFVEADHLRVGLCYSSRGFMPLIALILLLFVNGVNFYSMCNDVLTKNIRNHAVFIWILVDHAQIIELVVNFRLSLVHNSAMIKLFLLIIVGVWI